jgi:general secretion pathway protein K
MTRDGADLRPQESRSQDLRSRESRPQEQGIVIVAVLWILMALSVLAMIFSVYLSASAEALAVDDTGLRTEALVSASLELTAYQLAAADDKARPGSGTFHFRMDDADVVVNYVSEAARIDLNFAPREVLAGLFAGLGANKAQAGDDADRIIGWRARPSSGATNSEEALYQAAGLKYPPRQALFTHAGELTLVAGLPPALVERALPFVTVFNGTGDIDAKIAAPEVLAALPPRTSNQSSNQDAFGGPSALSNDAPALALADTSAPPTNAAPAATSTKTTSYRIETTINFGRGRPTVSEVVIALGDKAVPYRVLSWQDDIEPSGGVRKRGSS